MTCAATSFATAPTVTYGVNLLLAAVAYHVLQLSIFKGRGGDRLREALGRNAKGKVSPILYIVGVGLGFVAPWLALVVYSIVAMMWLVPDRRVECYLTQHPPVRDEPAAPR
jgi:uncharacterized membrane protein